MTHRRCNSLIPKGTVRPRALLILLGVLLLTARTGLAQGAIPNYIVTDLGVDGRAYAINADGQVAGTVAGGYAAFRWDPTTPNGTSGSVEDLGNLCPDQSCPGASAFGISAAGEVAGNARYDQTNRRRAFLTAPNSPINPFTDDLGASISCTQSEAHATNAYGQTVGWAQGCTWDTGCYRDGAAIVWSGTTATCISGPYPSVAYGINESGQVVGLMQNGGVLWQPGGGGWSPELIDPIGWPIAINNYGQVAINPFSSTEPRARLWTPDTVNGSSGILTYVVLPGQLTSQLNGINAQGQLVGESGGRAILWTPNMPNRTMGMTVDLNILIPEESGWELRDAQAINDAGQIVGSGLHNGAPRAFLLTPDSTPPTTTATVSPPANAAGWHADDVAVSLTATDGAGMGVAELVYSASGAQPIPLTTVPGASAQFSITAEGVTTVTYFASDLIGNVEPPNTLTIKLDRTPPVLTAGATAGGSPYSSGTWTALDVTVTFNCTDALSGMATTTPPRTIGTEGENQSADGTCADLAGNSASTSFTGIDVDKTAPYVDCGTADGQWHAVDVSIDCRADEILSGLRDPADALFALTTQVPVGTETTNAPTVSRAVCDLAGNCAMAGPIGFNMVDKKGPDIGITAPVDGAIYLVGEKVAAAYTCWDGGSSVASCTGTAPDGELIDTSSPGEMSFTVTATDNVGNTASREVGYSVVANVPLRLK